MQMFGQKFTERIDDASTLIMQNLQSFKKTHCYYKFFEIVFNERLYI